MRGDGPGELLSKVELYQALAELRAQSRKSASFGRSLDVLPTMSWPGELVIDARDEMGGRDWSVAIEPDCTSAQLAADPTFPVTAIVEAGAEGIVQAIDMLRLDQNPQQRAVQYITPRGQVIHVSGEKLRVSLGQVSITGGQLSSTFRVKVTATQGRPQRSFTSTDVVQLGDGASVSLRPPKYSTAYYAATPPIGFSAEQLDEVGANPTVPLFATSVPGQRIPLARRTTFLRLANASGATASFTVQWEIVA